MTPRKPQAMTPTKPHGALAELAVSLEETRIREQEQKSAQLKVSLKNIRALNTQLDELKIPLQAIQQQMQNLLRKEEKKITGRDLNVLNTQLLNLDEMGEKFNRINDKIRLFYHQAPLNMKLEHELKAAIQSYNKHYALIIGLEDSAKVIEWRYWKQNQPSISTSISGAAVFSSSPRQKRKGPHHSSESEKLSKRCHTA